MKRAIYPLYAPADEGKVQPILTALKAKGVAVRDPRTKAGKGDALLLFLSGNWQNGFIMVGIAWAVSPYGLPWIAECCWKGVDNLRGFVWRLVF